MSLDSLTKLFRRSRLLRAVLFPVYAARRASQRRRHRIQSQVMDHLAAQLVQDPVLEVSEFGGRFRIGKDSDVLRRLAADGHYEPDLARLCRSLVPKDRDAVDIGANIGFYTVLLATELTANRVLSIEPTPSALRRLQANIAMNEVESRVLVFGGAVSDKAGSMFMNVVEGREEYSSLGQMVHPSVRGAQVQRHEVQVETVDELVRQHQLDVGFVKMDVEGLELHVLLGMEKMIREHRPIILCELNDPQLKQNGYSARQLIAWLEEAAYTIHDPFDERMPPGRKSFGEILCIPQPAG